MVGVFEQHAILAGFVKGHAHLREVFGHQAQRKATHHLKARQRCAQVHLCHTQQVDRLLHARHGGPGGQLGRWQRIQLERGSGDHAQRAFAADHQVAQVVARVVFAQSGQAVPDLALRIDHLQPQAQIARIAIAQHLRAAGVGGQIAADGAAALGRQAQGKEQTGRACVLLQVLQDAAGLDGDRQVGLVDGQDLIHALQAEHHLRARCVGGRAHHQSGVAPLGHDADAVACTGLHHLCHFLGGGRSHHRQRLAAAAFAPV